MDCTGFFVYDRYIKATDEDGESILINTVMIDAIKIYDGGAALFTTDGFTYYVDGNIKDNIVVF